MKRSNARNLSSFTPEVCKMAKAAVKTKYSIRDFKNIDWHDNYIHAIRLDAEKFELILDIDFIHDWICGEGENYKFLISPSTLSFQNVSNLKIDIDWKDCSLDMSVGHVERSNPRKTANKKLNEYDWVIDLNWPEGSISFSATGFTQVSRSEPAVYDEQKIPADKRN